MVKPIFLFVMIVSFVPSTLRAADGFVGKWKCNPAKSTMHDQMKVTAAGTHRYTFDFGGGGELIAVDHGDQPGLEGSTLAVTTEGPRTWRVVRKKDGRMEISAIWNLSSDDKTLRDDFTGYQSDGSTFTIHYLYDRIAGTAGFAGTWDSTSENAGLIEVDVRPYGSHGLSFTNQAQHSAKLMMFDSKDYPVKGTNAPSGAMSSARRIDARTIEFTEKRGGKVADTQHIQLSADNRTLTMTIQRPNGSRPNVLVFERE